jgi:hypothetical protein
MRSGVIIASAVLPAFLLATEVSSVLAQTASAPTSKPIVLLRIVEQSTAKTTAKPVAKHKFASRSRIRRYARLAGRHHAVQARASEEVRPAADAPVVPPAPLQPLAPPAAEQLGKLVGGGHALQVASSAEVNEIDLPANSSLLQSNGAPPNSVTEDNPPMREIADAAKSAFANVTVTQEWGADVGSASWILQVLAALAGAVTAGTVAWFFIGRRPEDAATRGWRVWTQLLLVPPVFSEKRPFGSPRNVGSFI